MQIKEVLAEYGFAGLSGQESWDSSTLQTFLGVSQPFIQRCLRELNSDTLVAALSGDAIGAVRYRLLECMTPRTKQQVLVEIAQGSPSAADTAQARNEVLKVMQRQLVNYEEELWDQYHDRITPEIQTTVPDLDLLLSLGSEQLETLFNRLPVWQLSWAVGSSNDWAQLFHVVQPRLSEERIAKIADESIEPSFLWQIELAQRLLTSMGRLLVDQTTDPSVAGSGCHAVGQIDPSNAG